MQYASLPFGDERPCLLFILV